MLLSNYSDSSNVSFGSIPSMRGTTSELIEMNTTLLENINNYTLALARCEHQCIVENASEVILEGAITDFFGRIIDWLVAFWKKLVGYIKKKWDAIKKWFSTDYKKWLSDHSSALNKDYTGEEEFSPSCNWRSASDVANVEKSAKELAATILLQKVIGEIDANKTGAEIETTVDKIISDEETELDNLNDAWEKVDGDISFDKSGADAAKKYLIVADKNCSGAVAVAEKAGLKIINEAKKTASKNATIAAAKSNKYIGVSMCRDTQ